MSDRRKHGSPTRKRKTSSKRYWSATVMRKSNALDLKRGVFRMTSPRKIAMSLNGHPSKADAERARLINRPCRCSILT